MTGTEISVQATTCGTTRNACRSILGRSRFTANTSVRRSCHIRVNHPRNVTCHKPELCGLPQQRRELNLQNFKGQCTSKDLSGIKMFNAPSYSAAEQPEETPCHGLLGRGSRVTTRRSVATGENQSGVYSIKLTRMFNQRRKNRHAWRILSNLGNPERPRGRRC
ncbi:MAG: hypothetical protein JWN70_2077 [Planctomycetaceae bacterium]|nr:hypothetical protein [Planctomycetaceae bacterium]